MRAKSVPPWDTCQLALRARRAGRWASIIRTVDIDWNNLDLTPVGKGHRARANDTQRELFKILVRGGKTKAQALDIARFPKVHPEADIKRLMAEAEAARLGQAVVWAEEQASKSASAAKFYASVQLGWSESSTQRVENITYVDLPPAENRERWLQRAQEEADKRLAEMADKINVQ